MKTRHLIPGLLALAAMTCIAADGLDISLGLWEMTYTSAMSGMMMPQSALDKMTPEQREKMMAAMKKQAAAGPRTHSTKSCVTAKDLKAGAFTAEEEKDDPSCKQTIVAQTKNTQEVLVQCSGTEGRTGRMKIAAADSKHISGSIEMSSGNGKLNMQLAGKWLSASCAGADD